MNLDILTLCPLYTLFDPLDRVALYIIYSHGGNTRAPGPL